MSDSPETQPAKGGSSVVLSLVLSLVLSAAVTAGAVFGMVVPMIEEANAEASRAASQVTGMAAKVGEQDKALEGLKELHAKQGESLAALEASLKPGAPAAAPPADAGGGLDDAALVKPAAEAKPAEAPAAEAKPAEAPAAEAKPAEAPAAEAKPAAPADAAAAAGIK